MRARRATIHSEFRVLSFSLDHEFKSAHSGSIIVMHMHMHMIDIDVSNSSTG
jgi:hypothetical protein